MSFKSSQRISSLGRLKILVVIFTVSSKLLKESREQKVEHQCLLNTVHYTQLGLSFPGRVTHKSKMAITITVSGLLTNNLKIESQRWGRTGHELGRYHTIHCPLCKGVPERQRERDFPRAESHDSLSSSPFSDFLQPGINRRFQSCLLPKDLRHDLFILKS